MKIALKVVLSFALTMTGASASANSVLGHHADYFDDVRSYAKCAVRNNHNRVRQLLLVNVDNKTMERKFGDIYTAGALVFVPNCRELTLAFRSIIIEPDVFRAFAAEILVNKDLALGPSGDFGTVLPLSHLKAESDKIYQDKLTAAKFVKQRATLKEQHDRATSRAWLSAFGECVARKDPEKARDLVLSKFGSVDEDAAFSHLRPALGACLVEGESLGFDKYTLRGTVAINYYRLAMALRPVGEAKK